MKNPELDADFRNATRWRREADALRKILLDCGLAEERKWRQPCYVAEGPNFAIIQRMKDWPLIFFTRALLNAPKGALRGPARAARHL